MSDPRELVEEAKRRRLQAQIDMVEARRRALASAYLERQRAQPQFKPVKPETRDEPFMDAKGSIERSIGDQAQKTITSTARQTEAGPDMVSKAVSNAGKNLVNAVQESKNRRQSGRSQVSEAYETPIDAVGSVERGVGESAKTQAQSSQAGYVNKGPGYVDTKIKNAVSTPISNKSIQKIYETPIDAVGSVERGVGESAKTQAQSSGKQFQEPQSPREMAENLDKQIINVQDRLRESANQLESQAFESKDRGLEGRGLIEMTGAQLLRAGSGFIGGVTAPINPVGFIKSAQGAEELIINPEARKQLKTQIMLSPHGFIAETGGNILGGMALGYAGERIAQAIKGPQKTVKEFRVRLKGAKKQVQRGLVREESFIPEEVPLVRESSFIESYKVPKGSWSSKNAWRETGAGLELIQVPEGTPTSTVWRLKVDKKLRVSVPFGQGLGVETQYKSMFTPPSVPNLRGPGSILGLTERTRLGEGLIQTPGQSSYQEPERPPAPRMEPPIQEPGGDTTPTEEPPKPIPIVEPIPGPTPIPPIMKPRTQPVQEGGLVQEPISPMVPRAPTYPGYKPPGERKIPGMETLKAQTMENLISRHQMLKRGRRKYKTASPWEV